MPKEIIYSSEDAYNRAVSRNDVKLPSDENVVDSDSSEASLNDVALTPEEKNQQDIEKGAIVAQYMQQYGGTSWAPTFEEAMYFKKWKDTQEVNAWHEIGNGLLHTIGALGEGALELVKDTVTGKLHKVAGSAIEGAALGTKNWAYMMDEAKFNEDSFIHKMLYGTHSSDQDYYYNLKQSLEARRIIEKDQAEGILISPKTTIGGVEFDLTNRAVVQAVSYVADPSWLMPNLGIESMVGKGLQGSAKALQLGEQLEKASLYALNKGKSLSGTVSESAGKVANVIEATEDRLIKNFRDMTGTEIGVKGGGQAMFKENLTRGAMEGIGANAVRIPAWAMTTMVWGGAKIIEHGAKTAELAFELASKESPIAGMRLSERLAQESKNRVVQNLSTTWSKTVSPTMEYLAGLSKTSLHSGMYGGAFGLAFGGEEGFYNGIGSGIALGGAFHHIGVAHNTIAGGDSVRDTVKNFLWATEHMDYFNKEGIHQYLNIIEAEKGPEARLKAMSAIAGAERLARGDKRLYLTDERIRQLPLRTEEFARYEAMLADPSWGGVSFYNTTTNENVAIVAVERAGRSAVSEELFHTLMLGRYSGAFKKAAVDALIGTEDNAGALYKMPKERAIALVESFRDSYLQLDKTSKNHTVESQNEIVKDFNDAIEGLKNGERPETLSRAYEEFLASYWNRFIEDKPLDYLLKGGDLGLVRNAIQWGKDVYRDILHSDLKGAGAEFTWGHNPDSYFIDQTTKQRIRIPMLEELMRHYMKNAKKDMYDGWVQKPKNDNDFSVYFNHGLEHLVEVGDNGVARRKTDAQINKAEADGIVSAIQRLEEHYKNGGARGLTFTFTGGDERSVVEGNESMQPSKKKKKVQKKQKEQEAEGTRLAGSRLHPSEASDEAYWASIRKKRKANDTQSADPYSNIDAGELETMKSLDEAEAPAGANRGWDYYRERGTGYLRTEWAGNPRMKITGRATEAELDILTEFLPSSTVKTFNALNNVIERSRFANSAEASNILSAQVSTKSGVNARKFVPVEINVYFQKRRKGRVGEDGIQRYEVGDAQMLVRVMDWDALLTRLDFSWNHLGKDLGGSITYKTVRNLFGKKENLMEAVKAMLANYSNGKKAEAGIELFRTGDGSSREAGYKRDIVNSVIGFHPTKAQLNNGMREFTRQKGHYPLDMQLRENVDDKMLPPVVKDFRVGQVGSLRVFEGEGFKMDFDNSYIRVQYNHSPSKFGRDHEGNPIPSSAFHLVADTVYKNKEGEILTVYNLDTHNSQITPISKELPMENFIDDNLRHIFGKSVPSERGSGYSSNSGWLHFTPDPYEAGYVSDNRLKSGYIDTKAHIDISQLDAGASNKAVIETIAQRVSETSGKSSTSVLESLLKVKGFADLYKQTEGIANSESSPLNDWLFSRDSISFFRKYGVHSVEYNALNKVNGNQYSSVALFDGARFIENKTRTNELLKYSFQPAKPISERFSEEIRKAGSAESALLHYVLDSEGNPIPNTKLITEERLNKIIEEETQKIKDAQGYVAKFDPFSKKSREQAIQTLTPFVMAKLKQEFKFVPNKLLEQIAHLSLTGYHPDRVPSKSSGAIVTKESVFLREAKKYGITGERIRKTGIPSLGNWAEMTEKEAQFWRKRQQLLAIEQRAYDSVKREEGKEETMELRRKAFLEKPENAEFAKWLNSDEGRNQGNEISNRQRDLVFLVDTEVSSQRSQTPDGRKITTINNRKLKELFANKTKEFVLSVLKQSPVKGKAGFSMSLKQRQALLELKRGNASLEAVKLLDETKNGTTGLSEEISTVMSRYEDYKRQIESIFADEARERVEDILSAYHIGANSALEPKIVDYVRTSLYNEATTMGLQLGSPEAIRRSVELYAGYSEKHLGEVLDIKKAIRKNYVKALDELEAKGYRGTNWSESKALELVFTQSGGKLSSEEGKLEGEKIINYKTHGAIGFWQFDGTNYHIVESVDVNNKSTIAPRRVLELFNGRGDVVLRDTYDVGTRMKDGTYIDKTEEEVGLHRKEFMMMATKQLSDSTRMQELFSSYRKVEGPSKDFILRSMLSQGGHIDEVVSRYGLSTVTNTEQALYNAMYNQPLQDIEGQGRKPVKVATQRAISGTSQIVIGEVSGTGAIVKAHTPDVAFGMWELYNKGNTYLVIRKPDVSISSSESLKSRLGNYRESIKRYKDILDRGYKIMDAKKIQLDANDRIYYENALKAVQAKADAVPTSDFSKKASTATGEIEAIKKVLDAGYIQRGSSKKLLTVDEMVTLRDRMTQLEGFLNVDKGIVFQVDSMHNFTFPDVGLKINTLAKRAEALAKLQTGGYSLKSFEKYAESLYSNFDRNLKARNRSVQSKIEEVLWDPRGKSAEEKKKMKGVRGNIEKIRELAQIITEKEASFRSKLNEKGEQIRRDKKSTITDGAILADIAKQIDGARKNVDNWSDRVSVYQYQLAQFDALEGWANLSDAQKKDFRDHIARLFNAGKVEEYSVQKVNGDLNQHIQEIRATLARAKEQLSVYRKAYDDLEVLRDYRDETVQPLLRKIEFLATQYATAKGKTISKKDMKQLMGDVEVLTKDGKVSGLTKKKVDLSVLDRIGTGRESSMEYLPDVEGLTTHKSSLELDGRPEVIESPEQLEKAFRDGLMYVADRWRGVSTANDIQLQSVLNYGREHINSAIDVPNLESNYNKSFAKRLRSNSLSTNEQVWVQSPENKQIVDKLYDEWRNHKISDSELIQEVRMHHQLFELGEGGVKVLKLYDEIYKTRTDVASITAELESLTRVSQSQGTDIVRYNQLENIEQTPQHKLLIESLRKAERKRDLQVRRLEDALRDADKPDATPTTKLILTEIAQYKAEQSALANYEKSRADQIAIWKAEGEINKEATIKKFRDRIDLLNQANPALMLPPADTPVSDASAETQRFVYMFPTWSYNLGFKVNQNTAVSHGKAPVYYMGGVGELYFNPQGTVYKNVLRTEADAGRYKTVYLADYMELARLSKEYHEAHPDAPMSAEEQFAFGVFEPEFAHSDLFAKKSLKINQYGIQVMRDLADGIRDSFQVDDRGEYTEKGKQDRQRFLRMFATEAYNMITQGEAIRVEAFKRIRGLTDAEFDELKAQTPHEEFKKMLMSKEVIENGMYLINPQTQHLQISESNPHNYKTEVNKYGDVVERKNILTGKPVPFETTKGRFGLPIQTLVRADGFMREWQTMTAVHSSLFEGMPWQKEVYEQMPIERRMKLDGGTYKKLTLEGNAGQLRAQQIAYERANSKGQNPWFGQEGFDKPMTEEERVRTLLMGDTVRRVEASIQRWNLDVQTFVNERPFAVSHLLSLDDHLSFQDLDFENLSSGTFRESKDGRFIIQKVITQEGDAKKKEHAHYSVFYIGENFVSQQGGQIVNIPTSEIGIVSNTTEAQVLARFFDDNIQKLRYASKLVEGGQTESDLFKVGSEIINPDPRTKTLAPISRIPLFSEYVISEYMKQHGSTTMATVLKEQLSNIGDYGEMGWVKPNAQQGMILITPSMYGELNKTHRMGRNLEGHMVWEEKPKADTEAQQQENSKDVTTELNRPQSASQKFISDVSTWDIVSKVEGNSGGQYAPWATIKNKLGYTLIRIQKEKGTQAFRLFNPASAYLGEFHREQEAVDEILKYKSRNK